MPGFGGNVAGMNVSAMLRRPWPRAALFALPGIALAITGSTHPHYLTYTTSAHWTIMHLIGLLVFPLVGVALIALVWGRRDPLALIVIAGSYLYATCYTALDIVSGAAAGYVTYQLGPGELRPDEVGFLFQLGGRLEDVGAPAMLVAGIAVGIDALRRYRWRAAAPTVLIVVAGYSFLDSHIFWFRGALTVLVIGLATGWFAYLQATHADRQVPAVADA